MNYPKISIVILNWNGKSVTCSCLESLKKVDYPNYEIILVDNASEDGSQELFKKKFSYVKLIENKENLGFTGGNNVGIKYALKTGADYILLLNNDTEIQENFLKEILSPFRINSSIGLVGPKIVYFDNPKWVWAAGANYYKLVGKGKVIGHHSGYKKKHDKLKKTDWLTFCTVLIKAEVFNKIGLLDEDYFSSHEDLDFCIRAREKKYSCYYTPNTTVYHKVAQDWGGLDNPLYIYYQVRNNLLFFKKNRRNLMYLTSVFYYLSISTLRRCFNLIRNNESYKLKFILMGVTDFFKGNFKIGKLSKKIKAYLQYIKEKPLRLGINARYTQGVIAGIGAYTKEVIKNIGDIDSLNKYTLFACPHLPFEKITDNKNFKGYFTCHNTKNRVLRILWEQIFLAKEIRNKKIDVFHGTSFVLPFFKYCKYVLTIYDLSYLQYPKSYTFFNRWYLNLLVYLSVIRSDKIITISEYSKQEILKYFKVPKNKIKIVYPAVNDLYLQIKDKKRLNLVKKKYSLPDDYFLFVGSLMPRKNLLRIIKAYSLLKQQGEKTKLVVVGQKAWLYSPIFKLIRKLKLENDVIFTGYLPNEDISEIYTLAKSLVFPSIQEGFGMPILEAMSCGCPVITANVTAMPEVAGGAALLVNPFSVNEIANSMKKIIDDKKLRKDLIKKGFKRVKQFSWKIAAEKTLKIYEELGR